MTESADLRRQRIEAFLARHGLQLELTPLLSQSFTHRSYAFENKGIPDNERLEFLGDAVLGCLTADFLFREFPQDSEGPLSKKKAFLVSRRELGRRAKALQLDDLVLLGKGEEHTGGRRRTSVLGSALEALVGALFFELPFSQLQAFVHEAILEPGVAALQKDAHLDYKSRLQELVQRRAQTIPRYEKTGEAGPAHRKSFVIEVYIEGRKWGIGEGKRIKTAENQAARQALAALSKASHGTSDP